MAWRREPGAVLGRERVVRPLDGLARDEVEAVGVLDAARDLVVVAADGRGRREGAHAVDHGVRIRAVAHQVAEHQHALVPARGRRGQHRLQRVEVGVDVAQHQVAHG
jgi:hypothetical protein